MSRKTSANDASTFVGHQHPESVSVGAAADRAGRIPSGRFRWPSATGGLRVLVLVTALALVAGATAAPASTAGIPDTIGVRNLTTQHLHDPLGIDVRRPGLAWTLGSTGRGVRQEAYQIRVGTTQQRLRGKADVWDSGRVQAQESSDVAYAGPALESRTRYYWAIRWWDNRGNVSDWSEPAVFETGFLDPSEWGAKWIGKDTGTEITPEPLLRREFPVAGKIDSARVYIAGLGYHKLFINGQRIGDHELDPGFTDFRRTVLYVTHDVTEQLRRGKNAIGVSLGRGYYGSGGPITSCAAWCGQPKLKTELHIRYSDGSTSVVRSDEKWKVADGPTISDSIAAETYDARREQGGWKQAGYDDSTWSPASAVPAPAGVLRAQPNEPIRVRERLNAVAVTAPAPGVNVYDVGVVAAGWARIALQGAAGTTVTIQYSEKLRSDGTVQSQGGQTDVYVLRGGGREVYEPSYSYKGYQYVQVSGDPLPSILSFEALEVNSSVRSAGAFESSNELLNRYHKAMRRTILNNLHSVPTDTPVHEKLAYGGDALLYSESAIRNFGMAAFLSKWMSDFTDAQLENGMIPVVVPDGHAREEDDPVWGAAVVLIHTYLHTNYRDVSALRRDYPTMKRWMDLYAERLESSGYIFDGETYGDWTGCVISCSLPPIEQGPPNLSAGGGSAFPALIGTAFLYRASRELAEVARVIQEGEGAEQLDSLAKNISAAFHERFYNPVTRTYGDIPAYYVQTSNLLALSFKLAPNSVREAVEGNLSADVASRGDHLNTGAAGTKLILPALTDAGYGDQAYRVATNPTYPGWGHLFLECGATTMWESWTDCSSDVRRGGNPATGSTAPRSMNHAFFGTVDDWLFTHVAGITPTAPGFQEIQVKPHVVGDLQWATAHQTAPSGRVSSCWEKTPGGLVLTTRIPVNGTGTAWIPAADAGEVVEVGTGRAVPLAAADGVIQIRRDGDRIVAVVGSGDYAFLIGGASAAAGAEHCSLTEAEDASPAKAPAGVSAPAGLEPTGLRSRALPATGGGMAGVALFALLLAAAGRRWSAPRRGRSRA
jgi:alpha-L-rhamnosidase